MLVSEIANHVANSFPPFSICTASVKTLEGDLFIYPLDMGFTI